jgi:uncharacterized membrane protein
MAYNKKQIIDALHKSMGQVYLAASALGCAPNTIMNWVKRSPDVKAVIDSYRGEMVDLAELKLRDKLHSGDNWAIGFTLSRLGKSRGYVTTVDATIEHIVVIPPTMTREMSEDTEVENDEFQDGEQ